jgi:hypothetical protein
MGDELDPELEEMRAEFRRTSATRVAVGGVVITVAAVAFLLSPITVVAKYKVLGLAAAMTGAVIAVIGIGMRLAVRRPPPRVPPARARDV